jgi:hypothetical protein
VYFQLIGGIGTQTATAPFTAATGSTTSYDSSTKGAFLGFCIDGTKSQQVNYHYK